MRLAFIYVRLASRSRKALRTVARKRAGRIHANAVVFARRSLLTLVNVLRTIDTLVAGRTRARERAVDRTGVTNGVRMARIRGARIVQVTQQARLSGRTLAQEAAHAINACGSVKAGRAHTVVNVHTAIRPRPSVDADTGIATDHVRTGGTVLAHRRPIMFAGKREQ